MAKTHCGCKQVPYLLLFPPPAQLNWRLHSHLFQGLPAITWLLYSRDQFFTFFGLSSLFPLRLWDLSPYGPRVFSVDLTSSPWQKALFLSGKLHLLLISLARRTLLSQPAADCSPATPRQGLPGVFPHCWFPQQLSILPLILSTWAGLSKKDVNTWKVPESCDRSE